MIKEIEDALKQHLSQLGDRLKIASEANEATPNKYDFLLRANYRNASFQRPSSPEGFGKQEATRTFQVSIEIKDYQNKETYKALYEEVENLIIDFYPRVPGVIGAFYIQSSGFQKNQSRGIYEYVISCTLPVVVIKEKPSLGLYTHGI